MSRGKKPEIAANQRAEIWLPWKQKLWDFVQSNFRLGVTYINSNLASLQYFLNSYEIAAAVSQFKDEIVHSLTPKFYFLLCRVCKIRFALELQ